MDRERGRELYEKYRRHRDGIRKEPEMAHVCLICGSIHVVPETGNGLRLVCRNCGFAFFRYLCQACAETVDGRDPRNPGCAECGLRVCSCGRCGCDGREMSSRGEPS